MMNTQAEINAGDWNTTYGVRPHDLQTRTNPYAAFTINGFNSPIGFGCRSVSREKSQERIAVAALLRCYFANRRSFLAMFLVATSDLEQGQRQKLVEWIIKW